MENNNIQEAFVRGFLNKQAACGLEKEAFLPALLNLGLNIGGAVGGGMIGQQVFKKLVPKITNYAKAQHVVGAGAPVGFFSGNYNKVLGYLSKKKNTANLMDQTGMAAGGIIGSGAMLPFNAQVPPQY